MKLHHLEIHPGENGGHSVHHVAERKASKGGVFYEQPAPEQHHFGPEQGHEMLQHVANTLGVKAAAEDYDPEGEDMEEQEMPHSVAGKR